MPAGKGTGVYIYRDICNGLSGLGRVDAGGIWRLTCQSAVDLKHALHIRFGALKCIQIANKDARVDRLRIL